MKTSFSTLACPDWSLPEVLAAAVRYGYNGVELRGISRQLDLWTMPEFQSSSLPLTRKLIADHGLDIVCLGSSSVFHSSDGQERQRNLDAAVRMADVAAGLGTPAIRVFGDRIQAGNERQQTAGWIADSLMLLAEKVKGHNVQVWFETHGDFATAAAMDDLFKRINTRDIGIVWDPANAFAQSDETPQIPPSLSDRIQHVHLKDLVHDLQGKIEYVPTGDGKFPFDAMFHALNEINFSGFVSFEWERLWHPELAPPEVALPHFMQWWKRRALA